MSEKNNVENGNAQEKQFLRRKCDEDPDEDKEAEALQPFSHKIYRLTATGACSLTLAVLAFQNMITPAAIPDLRVRLRCTVADIATAMAFRSLGAMVGSITAGILNDKFKNYSQIMLAVSCFVSALAIGLMPWSGNTTNLSMLFCLVGLGSGCFDPVASRFVFNLWGKRSNGPIYMMHFGYVIGETLTPIIVSPFLSSDPEPVLPTNVTSMHKYYSDNDSISDPFLTTPILPSTDPYPPNDSRIEIAYLISAVIAVFVGFLMLVVRFIKPRNFVMYEAKSPTGSIKDVINPGACSGGKPCFGIIMVALLALYYASLVAFYSHIKLLFSYVYDSDTLNFSKKEGIMLITVNRGVGIAGRTIAMLVAPFLPIHILLFTVSYLLVASTAGLCFLGPRSKTFIWIFATTDTLFNSIQWPGAKVMVNQYITVTSFVISVSTVFYSSSAFLFDWLAGYMYTNISPRSILTVPFGASIAVAVVVTVIHLTALYGQNIGKRFNYEVEVGEEHVNSRNVEYDEKEDNEEEMPIKTEPKEVDK